MNNKKSQAAMEFLMTYGWAILIILIVMAALFFLGIFSPQLGNSCTSEAPFTSCDLKITSALATQQINVKFPVGAASVVTLNVNGVGGGITCTGPAAAQTLVSGTTTTFACTVSPGAVGTKYGGTITLGYTGTGGLTHNVIFSVSGVVE